MNHKTKQKIKFLQLYMNDWFKNWASLHPDNISGFRIALKEKKNTPGRNYAIVFQVVTKKRKADINEEHTIPSFISVPFPDGKTRKVPTDVQETGHGALQMANCTKPLSNGNIDAGTVGIFMKNTTNQTFAVTNYHVAAWERMVRNEFSFTGNDPNIFVNNMHANFVEGIFGEELDVAFIEVQQLPGYSNVLPDGIPITGFASGPYGPDFINKEAYVYCNSGQPRRRVIINNNAAVWNTQFKNIFLKDLLSFNRVTVKGNSGSPVMIGDAIIGIIVGADNLFSYAVPFYKIYNYNPLLIL